MKKAVVTICFGNAYNALGEVTHPTLRAYAKKIGADFHVVVQPKIPNPERLAYLYSYEKTQLRDFLLHYDRVIYLDTDIIVSSDCPDLFEVVPYGYFGAFSEGRWLERKDALAYAELQWTFLAKENVAEKWANNYFNAGVMVVDKTHHQIFALPEVLYNNFYDQTWFNCQVAIRCPAMFQDLTHAFNRMRHIDWARRMDAFIIHYAGGGVPLDQIRKDIITWQSR